MSACGVPTCAGEAGPSGVCWAHRRAELAIVDLDLAVECEDLHREAHRAPRGLEERVARLVLDPRPWSPPAPPPDRSAWSHADGTPYGLAVLSGACGAIRSAGEGTRNETIARRAFTVGGYVAGGEIDESRAMRELCAAAQAVAGRDRAQMVDTAKRALRAGMAHALNAPAPPAPPAPPPRRALRRPRRVRTPR